MFRFSNLIIFELTRDCNLKCKYCYVLDKDLYKHEKIDFTLYKHLIDRIADQRIINGKKDQILNLNFHGGEVTMVGKKHFKRCAEYAAKVFSSRGVAFHLGMQTNGSLLDEEFLEIIKFYGLTIGLSFDSVVEESPLRFSPAVKNKILDVCKIARNKGLFVNALSVLTTQNKDTIVEDDAKLKEAGITGRKINFAEDMENPLNSSFEVSGKEIFETFLKPEVSRYLSDVSFIEGHIHELLDYFLIDILTCHSNSFNTGCNGKVCGAGISMLAVRPDGTMGYCDRYSMDFKGNFIEHALDYDFLGLHQLNMAIQLAKTRNKVLKETGCDHCRARYICEGGCQAFFFSKFGYYGIQKDLICDQFILFYDYCKEHLLDILHGYIKNKKKIEIPHGTSFFFFKEDVLDYLYQNKISLAINNNLITIKELK